MEHGRSVKKYLIKYWFFIGIAVAVLLAFNIPVVGIKIKEWQLLRIGIFLAFFINGLELQTKSIFDEIKNIKGLAVAILSSLLFFPALAYLLANIMLRGLTDFTVGAILIAVVPVTIASGTVLTGLARGNIPLSILICIAVNLVALFTIPVSLRILLQFEQNIDLSAAGLLQNLLLIVLLPTVLGQIARTQVKDRLSRYHRAFSYFSQTVILMIILNAVSSSTVQLVQTGHQILYLFLFMILLHAMVLAMNYGLSQVLKFDRPSTAAFTIHVSQKTLTVPYIVWAASFSAALPMAMIPPIVYHLTQMVSDTFVADLFRRQAEKEHAPLP